MAGLIDYLELFCLLASTDAPGQYSECDDEDSLHSGPEMVEEMMRKMIQKNLGYKSGQRRSLPTSRRILYNIGLIIS